MNIFVAIMLAFAGIGLLDEMMGGRYGLAVEFEKGIATMGNLALSTIGFYCIGVASVQNNAEAIGALASHMPFDSSLLIGCLLAPDMGAFPIAQNLAASPSIAIFTGALVAGGLGMTIAFQLPVFLASVKKTEVPELMRGFIFGLIALPAGLIAGGLMLGLSFPVVFVNMIPVLVLCGILIVAFLAAPEKTTKCLVAIGMVIRIISFLFFGIVMFGVFVPQYALVDVGLVYEMLYLVLRMVIVACGGLVLSRIALKKLNKPVDAVAKKMGINREAVVGLFLSFTQSLAMLPLFSQMDKRGQAVNAAFSVCGAYIVGGQMAFVAALAPEATGAFMVNKAVAGILAVILAVIFYNGEKTQDVQDDRI